jgi:hypothetical protein
MKSLQSGVGSVPSSSIAIVAPANPLSSAGSAKRSPHHHQQAAVMNNLKIIADAYL